WKKRAEEIYEKLKEERDYSQALQKRLSEAEKRVSVLQMLTEQYAFRLGQFEKGTVDELQGLFQPGAIDRMAEPVNAAKEGDWISYSRVCVSADGKKAEDSLKISIASKAEKKVTLKR